jgi:uncharacterized protein (TIGR00255 family)
MLHSMTGYGQGNATDGLRTCSVEIRGLNSRGYECNLKLPPLLRVFEQDIRRLTSERMSRGKVEILFNWQDEAIQAAGIDLEKLAAYWNVLEKFANDNQILPSDRLLASLLHMPEVSTTNVTTYGEKEWELCKKALHTAFDNVMIFRKREGEILEKDILQQVQTILSKLDAIAPYDAARVLRIRDRIREHAAELLQSSALDINRLEQEMLYYIERLDISEEKIRLQAHCEYFIQVCASDVPETGKKLHFIAQEIGREINTIGSKANDADIQRLVVDMKDALEKVKEQLANVV